MYQINQQHNNISPIKPASFSSLNYTERNHLQEWIASTPEIFWEDLLIIQKEFDGFNDTRERLDLLALDKQGNLVIIENKLDDTGRDVVWQSLKYASYCSTLKKWDIINIFQSYLDKYTQGKTTQSELELFYEWQELDEIEFNTTQSQRLILVAANFRKEVTSTVLRLMNYGLRVQCFKATVYAQWENHFLTLDQIIPIKDAEDYTIKMAEKQQEQAQIQTKQPERHKIRKEFWQRLLPISNTLTTLFSNISPTTDHWISAWSGISWVPYTYVITRSYCAIELYPWHKETAEENMKVFEYLYMHKDQIEESFGDKLHRDRLEWKKATRISYRLDWVSIFNQEDWEKMIKFLTTNMAKLHRACDPVLREYR
jgi:hypothetical protein